MKLLKDETIKSTQSMENWLSYLDGASRNYKYGFSEQLLINNQKPNATAVADYDTWRGKPLHRIVKTGTAMYIPSNINGKLTVKNYFDVEDTIATSKSLPLPQWGYSAEHEKAVKDLLSEQYELYGAPFGNIQEDADIGDVMDYTFDCLSKKYMEENSEALDRAFEGSGLMADAPDLDDRYDREQAFESVVYASTALIINKRLGIRPELNEALELIIQPYLHHFNTEDSINALGNAVSSISEEYLRIAETAIKAYDKEMKIQKERELNEERVHPGGHEGHDLLRAADPTGVRGNDLENEGGRHDTQQVGIQQPVVHNGLDGRERPDNQNAVPQHSNGRSLETADSVGLGENGLLEGKQEVHGGTNGDNRTSQALSGSGGTGRSAEEIHDGTNPQRPEQQSHREGQSGRPDGLGAEDEQLSSDDSRNDLQRPNLRLNSENNPNSQNSITTEEASADAGAFSMSEMPLEEILDNREEMIRRIIADILKHDPEHPVKSIEGMKSDYRSATIEGLREAYLFYFPTDTPVIEAEQEAPPAYELPKDDLGAFAMQKIPPMFVVDWDEVQYDFDLALYEDGDMVAYNKDGVSFKVGKMGDYTFITTTTSLTPMGDILGDRDIPDFVRQQMRAYRNGNITADQVRTETMQRLETYITQREKSLGSRPIWKEYADLHFQAPERYNFVQWGDAYEIYGAKSILVAHDLKLPIKRMELPGSKEMQNVVKIPTRAFESYANRLLNEGIDISIRDSQGNIEYRSAADKEEIVFPVGVAHSPLLKGWYVALGQDEELTYRLARGYNKMLDGGMEITRKGQFQAAFEKMSAPILQQSKLSDAAFKVFDDRAVVVTGQHSLTFGSLGNGITVWDRLNDAPETRDYKTLAHIGADRNITWYADDVPETLKAQIIDKAENSTDESLVDLVVFNERKKWLNMIDEMVSTNGFITKEDFAFTPFDKHGGLPKFVELYGLDGYEPVLNNINKKVLPQGLDNIHELFGKQYPGRVIAVAADAGFMDIRHIPAETGLSLSVKEGTFRRRSSGEEYGKLLSRLREKGVPVIVVYPQDGHIFVHNYKDAPVREVQQTLSPVGNEQQDLQQDTILGENQHIENVGGVDFVVTTVRSNQQSREIVEQPTLEATTTPRSVVISAGNLFGFAQPSSQNTNSDVPGKYSDTYFRINGNGYNTGDWNDWSENKSKVFQDEVNDILINQGWTIHEPSMSAASPTATKGKNHLYLHPQNFSGVCENAERVRVYEALQAGTTFACSSVDVYREIYDMSDEQLLENLNNEKEAIEQDLLQFYTTKRSNLYVTTEPSYNVIKRLAIEGKHGRDGVDGRTQGICQNFVGEVKQALVDSGKLKTSQTRNGLGYRAANEAELKDLQLTLSLFDEPEPVQSVSNEPMAETPVVLPSFNVGDRLDYDGHPHEINRIDNTYVRLQNLSKPTDLPIIDYTTLYREHFERMLSDGTITNLVDAEAIQQPEIEKNTGKPYELGVFPMGGNGLVVYNSFETDIAKYKAGHVLADDMEKDEGILAHIHHERYVVWHSENIPDDVKNQIKDIAKNSDNSRLINNSELSDRVSRRTAYAEYRGDNWDNSLASVHAELDRKAELLSDYIVSADMILLREAFEYLKYWREMPNLVGISADVLVQQINELSDEGAISYLQTVPWDNWQNFFDIGDVNDKDNKESQSEKITPKSQHSTYKGTPMWQDYQSLTNQHPDRVLFYKLGDFYEVLGDKAPTVAEALNVALTSRDIGLEERAPMLGVPEHTLDSYIQILADKGFDVVVRHNQDEVALIPLPQQEVEPPHPSETVEKSEWLKTCEDIAQNTADYTEPFVVIEFMEGVDGQKAFNSMDRLTFSEADQKFKEVEAAFRAETENAGYYDKTYGAVFYKENPEDAELSVYGFRYDVGDYDEEHSGLYNHISNYWGYIEEAKAAQPDVYSYISDEDIASNKKMLGVLADYVEVVPVYKSRIPNRSPEIGDEVYHGGELHRLDGIDGLMIKLFNLETNNQAAMITTKERFFEGLQEDERNRHLFFSDEPQATIVTSPINETAQAPKEPSPKNFRMDNVDYANIAAGGAKSKFKRNIEAIRTLQAIEGDGRKATPEEQEILAHYVGWGGIQDAFNGRNEQWREEYNELKELLSPDEYEAARASVLTAYYTEPTIMNAMWDKVEQLGGFSNYGDTLKSVNVLEPSAGVGNFLGVMPEHIGNTANVHGVEIDSISGRIAKQLYPEAKIQIKGFEKTMFTDDMFDVVIGNVPFSESIKPVDWQYDKDNLLVHDYFFNKALDKVRPGGVVAFITSAGTLDKVDDKARIMMAEKAELLGAIRLPNNAFKQNAGTEVVSDIIFLQKREEPLDLSKSNIIPDELDWVHSVVTKESGRHPETGHWYGEQRMNSYFAQNPHMVLGENKLVSTQYGQRYTILPIEGADLGEQLREAMAHISGSIPVREVPEVEIDEEEQSNYFFYSAEKRAYQKSEHWSDDRDWIYEDIKDNAYAVIDNKVYFRSNHRLGEVEAPAATLERIAGMVSLRNVLRDLIQAQVDDRPDVEIKHLQTELNASYDRFTKKHGLITSQGNSQAFDKDDSYYLLASLERLNDELEFEGKSDIFTKRTIKPHIEITSVNTSSEALGVSIGYRGEVDLDYMAQLTGFDKQRIINDLEGVIFYCPQNGVYIPADEYLSGNVRKKLEFAKAYAEEHPDFVEQYKINTNITALEMAQPTPLEAHEIYVRLGTTWIDNGYVQQFMNEILETPNAFRDEIGEDGKRTRTWETDKQAERDRITVQYSNVTNEWRLTNKNAVDGSNIKANVEYGTSRINAYHIIEQTLNLKDVVVKDKVYDGEGREREVVNEEETILAKQKQEDLKAAFREWIFKNPVRRQALVAKYNERFNSTRPREYDGSHITFGGMNAEIKLEPHQVNAVARVMYGGNTLLAHEVGAGKSFEMIAAAMEAKRIGLCNKSLIAVPKHLTGQMASEFLRLYPNANILVATDKTFEPKNRKKFCAKIATGNYDAIIMGHTQFEMIPLSKENQERYYREQFEQLVHAINEAKAADSGYFTVKQMENTKNKVKAKLDNLYKDGRKDDVITFEQLGVDKIFVDEAHNYKNLHLYTKMRNVAGISQTEAQKSADMFMKCRYLDEETGSKGIVFATGTPISNSLTEMYTMQRYLQYETLQDLGLEHFDSWASIFTEPTSDMELAPEGGGYRMRTRCARFQNLPELMNTFHEVADIKTAESLNLPRPKANFHTISCEPTEHQKAMVQGLSERADAVRSRAVKPHEDNMLAITNDGRKLGLDQRVINPNLPDDPNSKINAATNNIFDIWERTKEDRLTQVVFCDLSTPSAKNKKEHGFNVYDDVKRKLIERGVPEKEIAFVHDYNSDKQKQKLFAKVRAGSIRVVFGSTEKMGAGTNIQDKLVALHSLDCPWRPSDLAQREGRILRRGNNNPEIDIYKYVTKDTFDAYLYQTIEKKQQFISQIMTEKSPMRTVDDVDQSVLDFAEIKALCVGNPKIKEKMDLEHDLRNLTALHSQYKKNLYRMENSLMKDFPAQITAKERNIENYISDEARLAKGTVAVSEGISPMVIDGKTYHERVKAGEAIKAACQSVSSTDGVKIGTYRGFELHLSFNQWTSDHFLTVRGDMPYPIKLEGNFPTQGVVTRIDNVLDKIPEYIKNEKESLENTINQMEAAKIEVAKPFPQEEVMKEKLARVTQLNVELSLDAQKTQEGETNIDEIDEADIDGEFEHDAEHDEDYDLEYGDEENETYETYESHEHQTNAESITETFEAAENGGQGAFVSGDIHVEKATEKIPAVPDALREVQKAAPNNIYIVGMKPNTPESAGENTHTQTTVATPTSKVRRSYSER